MKLADTHQDIDKAPHDPFKTTYSRQKIKDDVVGKVHTINHWSAKGDAVTNPEFVKGFKKVQKWSE